MLYLERCWKLTNEGKIRHAFAVVAEENAYHPIREYLNALLLADFLGFEFMDAAELICFHSDGTYDDETTQKWTQRLEGRKGLVIPGFYGRKRDGSIKTFSRGGSDITGAIVARAVHADVYENWTDVSGFLISDPRIVKNPKVIRTVSYSELRELSYICLLYTSPSPRD